MDFKERVAVVTGASRGIGRAIAERLGAGGATVIVTYSQDAAGAEVTAQAVRAAGGAADVAQADVSDFAAAEALIKDAVKAHGRIDILVNNAGTTRDQGIMRMSEEDWDTVLAVNLNSAYNCSKAAVRSMMRKRQGRILNNT